MRRCKDSLDVDFMMDSHRCFAVYTAILPQAAEVVKTMGTKLRPVPKDVASIDKREYAEPTLQKLEASVHWQV